MMHMWRPENCSNASASWTCAMIAQCAFTDGSVLRQYTGGDPQGAAKIAQLQCFPPIVPVQTSGSNQGISRLNAGRAEGLRHLLC